MSTLKDLLRRIKGIRSTQKITAAMKMVAASKLRRSQTALESFRPYSQGIRELVDYFFSQEIDTENWPTMSQILLKGREGPPLFLIISADRGLCGGYNSNLMRSLRSQLLLTEDFRLAIIGRKGKELLSGPWKDKILPLTSNQENISSTEIAQELKHWLDQGVIGSIQVIHHVFKNILQQNIQVTQLVPFTFPNHFSSQLTPFFLIEPDFEILGPQLLEDRFKIELQNILLESTACEHAARMIAMESATRNAGEILQKLQSTYNRTRQAQITNQLIEIISAAQAV
jgi:F-type H+-transporting ATPase subunit gamma